MPEFPAARCNLGTCYKHQGRFDEAINQNQIALRLSPFMVDPYVNIGNTFKELGRIEESLTFYKRATELDPNNYLHYSNLGVSSILTIRMH